MAKKRAARKSNRTPVGGARSKLTVPESIKDEGFHYHWVNDEGGNIRQHLDAGYEFVEDPDIEVGQESIERGRPTTATVSVEVGRTRYSSNGTAYLMRQPLEYYNEDQQEKQSELDEVEETMFKANSDQGQYVKEYDRRRGDL
jgi:hypothetical protein